MIHIKVGMFSFNSSLTVRALQWDTHVIGQVRRTIIYYVIGYVFIGRVRTLIISYVVGRACCNVVSYSRMFHSPIQSPLKNR